MAEEQDAPATDSVTERALEAIQAAYPDAIAPSDAGAEWNTGGIHPWIRVGVDAVRDVLTLLRDDDSLQMDSLHLISAVDYPGKGADVGEIEVVYHLVSYALKADAEYLKNKVKSDPFVAIKVRVPRDKPEVPTVMDLWTGADWHERETFDLMGVIFTGRDELPRILLPDDWPGHPLRKDWEFPASYHGIPIVPPEGL